MRKRVFVCSPLGAPTREGIQANIEQAWRLCRSVVLEGYRPFAPHGFYTMFLDEMSLEERNLGIDLGIEELASCDELWYWGTPSAGMIKEIDYCNANGITVVFKGELHKMLTTHELQVAIEKLEEKEAASEQA